MANQFTMKDQSTRGFHNASAYDKNRPSYSADSVEKLLQHLGVAGMAAAKVIDLACGTGKFTVPLVERPEKFEIVAVEPHAEMRKELEKKALADVKVVDGNAAKIEVEDGWAGMYFFV